MDPVLGERHILGVSGIQGSSTSWRVHRLLVGLDVEEERERGLLEVGLRKAAFHVLTAGRGLRTEKFGGPLSFQGRFHCTKPWVCAADDGVFRAGDVVMLEMPDRRSYDWSWRDGYGAAPPADVVARANVRMAVVGGDRACVWAVGDNGEIDEVHVVDRDEALVAAMRRACRIAEEDALAGLEPPPGEDDAAEAARLASRDGTRVVVPEEGQAWTAFQAWRGADAGAADANASARSYRKDRDRSASVLLRSLASASVLVMPDGSEVSVHVVTSDKPAQREVRTGLRVKAPVVSDGG